MTVRTLVVGGTGPTGPFIVEGLRQRGHQVTIFHRGTHEIPEIPPEVEHIHGDPHFPETIAEAMGAPTKPGMATTWIPMRTTSPNWWPRWDFGMRST